MRSPLARDKAERGAQRWDDRATGLPRSLFHTVASRIAAQKISDSTALPSLERVQAKSKLQNDDTGNLLFAFGYSALGGTDVMDGVASPFVSLTAPSVFYRFEDGIDSTGGGLDLTNTGSVGTVSGLIGNSASFDGSTVQYYSRADAALLSGGARSWSGIAWFYVSEVPPSYDRCLVSKGRISTNREYRVFLSTSDYLMFTVYDTTGTAYTVSNTSAAAISTLLNRWNFAYWGYNDTTNEIFIAVNGATDRLMLGGNPVRDLSDDFRVGIVDPSSGTASVRACWKGQIDAMGLFSDELDTPTLTTLYNSGMGLEYESGAWHG